MVPFYNVIKWMSSSFVNFYLIYFFDRPDDENGNLPLFDVNFFNACIYKCTWTILSKERHVHFPLIYSAFDAFLAQHDGGFIELFYDEHFWFCRSGVAGLVSALCGELLTAFENNIRFNFLS